MPSLQPAARQLFLSRLVSCHHEHHDRDVRHAACASHRDRALLTAIYIWDENAEKTNAVCSRCVSQHGRLDMLRRGGQSSESSWTYRHVSAIHTKYSVGGTHSFERAFAVLESTWYCHFIPSLSCPFQVHWCHKWYSKWSTSIRCSCTCPSLHPY
jgi:hypothetical protein